MALTHGIKPIVTSGLVLCLDAGNIKSYPGIGTAWTDLSGRGGIGTLTNGPTYNSANGGSFSFDGIDDYVSSVSNLTLANNFSVSLWLRSTNSYPVQEKYISLGSDRIVIQSNEIGNLSSYVTDSTQQNLFTWGFNNQGRTGNNGGNVPVTTFAGGTNWKQVSQSNANGSAIKTDGTLWSWGVVVGDNTGAGKTIPVTTFAGGTNWKSVAAGYLYAAAIKTDGSLWTWGTGSSGQLGTNDTTQRNTPVTTFAGGNNWKQVSCGREHTSAIKTDGSLWTWGRGSSGQLGINNTDDRSIPVTTFTGGTTWKQVACGYLHTAAIKTDGSLWTWGDNNGGGLGDNTATNRSTPITTFAGGTNWKSVSGGNGSTAAIKTDGSLWTWGLGNSNNLGADGASGRSTPITTFAGGNNWKQSSISDTTAAAIKTDGTFINDDDSNISLLNTKYYNISLTCNGTTIKIHLDSTEILSTTINGTLTSTDVSFTVSSLLDCFKGNLSQALIYNRALTAGEIQQNFNATRSRFGV